MVINCIDVTLLVGVLANVSAPEFLGPFYNDSDVEFYFICRILYTEGVEVNFDVTLLFDGELEAGVAFTTVASAATFDVVFTPDNFTGLYGKLVRHTSCYCCHCKHPINDHYFLFFARNYVLN